MDTEHGAPGWPHIVAIVGPTAIGKSALALKLAEALDADIVSADSRQVYRYMDIGTAKATRAEQACARHYMLDVVAPDETYSAQRFAQEARKVLRMMGSEGRIALVVGGTGFYLRALLDSLKLPDVKPDPRLRERLRLEAHESGPAKLHARLASLDPASAERIHKNNVNRLVRALEIVIATGKPVQSPEATPAIPALYLGLTMSRAALRERANHRVLEQVGAGLVQETDRLTAMGYATDRGPLSGFGYRQAIDHLQGRSTLQEAVARYQVATLQYIRRQDTWFRSDPRIRWLDVSEQTESAAMKEIESYLRAEGRNLPRS
jgi:tRNA dimethylallyltransferase